MAVLTTLSRLLEEGYVIRTGDMPGADDLTMRIYPAMAQKERELISERTRATTGAANRSCRPAEGFSAAAAAQARRAAAERAAHRLAQEVEQLRAEGVVGQAALAPALNERGIPLPSGRGAWTYTPVARKMAQAAASA